MKKTKYYISIAIALLLFSIGMLGKKDVVAEASAKVKVPQNLNGTVEITNEMLTVLTISWDKVEGADGYEVYYRANVPGAKDDSWEEWSKDNTVETTAQGSIIDGHFQMRVRAYKGSTYSDFTDVITVQGGTGMIDNPAIQMSFSKKTIYTGETLPLSLNNATDTVSWKSSDKKCATVSKKGEVKGVSKGTVTVTATHKGIKYTCKVTVKKLTAAKAYADFMKMDKQYYSYSSNLGNKTAYYKADKFTLLDVDKDGTKELLLADLVDRGTDYVRVYSFKNNKIVDVGFVNIANTVYSAKHKALVHYDPYEDHARGVIVYYIKNDRIDILTSVFYDSIYQNDPEGEKKFNSYMKKYVKGSAEIKYYDCTESNIAKYCK